MGRSVPALSADELSAYVAHSLPPRVSNQTINEQPPVQMVRFMLEAACQHAFTFDHDGLAAPIGAPHSGIHRPLSRIPEPWDGQASFILYLLALKGLDDGVNDVPDLAVDVIGKDPLAHSDLVCRQPRATRPGDRLLEIGHQAGQDVIEPRYWIT